MRAARAAARARRAAKPSAGDRARAAAPKRAPAATRGGRRRARRAAREDAPRREARAEAGRADAAEQAEREKAELREKLQQQLNIILETRESARGLIVNMSDVLFDTARHTLRPGAREKLARVAGIMLAHPGLNIEVEGHTDSVGGDNYNQGLSERRAESVRDYLVQQGIPRDTIVATASARRSRWPRTQRRGASAEPPRRTRVQANRLR